MALPAGRWVLHEGPAQDPKSILLRQRLGPTRLYSFLTRPHQRLRSKPAYADIEIYQWRIFHPLASVLSPVLYKIVSSLFLQAC